VHTYPLGTSSLPLDSRRDSSYLLAFGFGTSVAMWGVGYLLRLPPVWMPSAGLLAVLLTCQAIGAFLAVKSTGRGLKAGAAVGAFSAVINLLVLGSILGEGESMARAAIWVPGSILVGAILGVIGGLVARAAGGSVQAITEGDHAIDRAGSRSELRAPQSGAVVRDAVPAGSVWTERFAQVAVCATLFLILVGGVVTSEEAGLAVVDWPNSFGRNMFLFPLSRMTGGVYYEHAHRLFGSLVGLTTLVLAFHIQMTEPRRWLKGLGWLAVLMVIVQGILGGLRVTGHFTSSEDPSITSPNLTLALVHGVFGQLFFGTLVAIAVFTSRLWREARIPFVSEKVGTDRRLSALLVAFVVVQLVFGAILRHTDGGLHLHVTMAVIVLVLGQIVGSRGLTYYAGAPDYRHMSKILIGLIGTQLVLGIAALMAVALAQGQVDPPAYAVVLTTAHQANGALILATCVVLALWSRRILTPR